MEEHGFGTRFGVSIYFFLFLFIAHLAYSTVDAQSDDGSSNAVTAAPGQVVPGYIVLGGNELNAISITVEGDTTNWELDPTKSPVISQGTLVVKGNGPWKVSVSSDTDGYMVEYDNDNHYVPGGKKLNTPMNITAQGGNTVDLSKGGVLIEGSGEKIVPIAFEQIVTWKDQSLQQNHIYKAYISFLESDE
jgi:hypothetical protein